MGGATSVSFPNGDGSNMRPVPGQTIIGFYQDGVYSSFNGSPFTLMGNKDINLETIWNQLKSIPQNGVPTDYSVAITTLHTQLSGLMQNLSAISASNNSDITSIKNDLAILDGRLTTSNLSNQTQSQIDQLKNALSVLSTRVDDVEAKNTSLEASNTSLTKALSDLTARVAKLEPTSGSTSDSTSGTTTTTPPV